MTLATGALIVGIVLVGMGIFGLIAYGASGGKAVWLDNLLGPAAYGTVILCILFLVGLALKESLKTMGFSA